MLTGTGRRMRALVTGMALVLLLLGTAFGDDEHFPFGPFRMYSTSNELDGVVNAARVEMTTSTGELIETVISPRAFGLRRAEIEGQIPRMRENPALLQHVIDAYEHYNPDVDVVGIRLFHEVTQLQDGRPVDTHEETLATWETT